MAARLSAAVQKLSLRLNDGSPRDAKSWSIELGNFLRDVRPHTEVEAGELEPSLELVARILMDSDWISSPHHLDYRFWTKLTKAIDRVLGSLPPERLPDSFSRVWIRVHEELEQRVSNHVIDLTLPRIHAFKERISRLAPGLVESREISALQIVVQQTLVDLGAHRWPQPTIVDLRALVERSVFVPPIVDLTMESDEERPPVWFVRSADPVFVEVDTEQVIGVIRSLLENAWRHALLATNAEIRIEVRKVVQHAEIEISNSGFNVSNHILDKLNCSAGAPVTDAYGYHGSGFGTRACHRVIALHHGNLRFSTGAHGRALQVTIQLPLAEDSKDNVDDAFDQPSPDSR